MLPASGFIVAQGKRLEYRYVEVSHDPGPTLVLLHEGLGCVALWKDVPQRLAQATGLNVFCYSRAGYGRSQRADLPRAVDYLTVEGERTLPEVLTRAGIGDCILIGHSDGASIALVYAALADSKCRGLVVLAPHVFVEPMGLRAIRDVAVQYRVGDLRERLSRHHEDNVDHAFWGWHDVWLDPRFQHWNITARLTDINAPLLVIQGAQDQYGTRAQLDAIATNAGPEVRCLLLADCAHYPFRDQSVATFSAITDFVSDVWS